MKTIALGLFLITTFSCAKKGDSINENNKSDSSDIITNASPNLYVDTQSSKLLGIWKFQSAILDKDIELPDNEKLALVKDKVIEITNNLLIVRNECQSELYFKKESVLDYWGTEKNVTLQRLAFKRAGLILTDSVVVIINPKTEEGCQLPFSELLFFDNKIISTMYPYITTFTKEKTSCFINSNDLEVPFKSLDIKKITSRHELQCEFNDLEKFRCGNSAIEYYKVESKNGFVFAIFPQDCGDSEFSYFVIFKNDKIIDELVIDKVAESEFNDKRALNYTECEIDENYEIHLKHHTVIDGESDSKEESEEYYIINDEGKFVIK